MTETLTLTSVSGTLGQSVLCHGIAEGTAVAGLDVSINGQVSWATGTGFSATGTTAPQTWSVLGPALPIYGNYEILVRDTANPGTLSNTEYFSLAFPNEALTLTSLAGTLGGTLSVGGIQTNGAAASLDVSVNGTWTAASNYTTATVGGTLTFSASGPVLATAGATPVIVRDRLNPGILSNTETLQVPFAPSGDQETLVLQSASGAIGELLSLGGVSDNGPPTSLDVSLSTVGSWVLGSSFESAAGTVNAAFSLKGPQITTLGTQTVAVRDSNTTTIVSNTLTLVTVLPETLFLNSATGTYGQGVVLSGVSNNGPPSALDVTLDGGVTWTPAQEYATQSGSLNAAWTGIGPNLG